MDPVDRFNPELSTIGLNYYQYVLWNPVRLIDPDGRMEAINENGAVTYKATEGDWLSKIANQTGSTTAAIIGANPQFDNPDKIEIGDKINIPSNTNMKRFEAAVKKIGSTDWAKSAEKGAFKSGSYKCNQFVANINTSIGASTPNNIHNGQPSPWLATANTWGNKDDSTLGNYSVKPENQAIAGDVVSFKKNNGSSGHVGVYTGGISIGTVTGKRFIGAGTNSVTTPTIQYWKNKDGYAAPVYRRGE